MRWLDWLMPESCAACRRDAPTRGAPICLPCRRSLQSRLPPAEPACAPAGVRLTRAAFPYEDPIPSLLRAFKYDARLRVGRTLARRFAARWPLFPELDFASSEFCEFESTRENPIGKRTALSPDRSGRTDRPGESAIICVPSVPPAEQLRLSSSILPLLAPLGAIDSTQPTISQTRCLTSSVFITG